MEQAVCLTWAAVRENRFPLTLLQQGWQVTGVDFSSRMLELAHRYQPDMKTIFADIGEVDFPDEQFDAVTAIYCLFHIEYQKHEEIFRKIYHWLKPGGHSLFTYATKEYTGAEVFNGYKEFLGEQLFYSHTTPDNLFASFKIDRFYDRVRPISPDRRRNFSVDDDCQTGWISLRKRRCCFAIEKDQGILKILTPGGG